MANQKENMIRLGIFVTIGIILFIIGIYYIGNSKNLFGKTFTLYADFSNVSGLQAGNNVHFMGINVGSVHEIEIHNDSTLRVRMTMMNSVRKNLKKDAIASINTDGLVGGAIVSINPGVGKLPAVEDGDIISSRRSANMAEMLQTLEKTNDNIALLAITLLEITEKINKGEGAISALLNDGDLTLKLNESMVQIQKTSRNLASFSKELNQMVAETQKGKGLLGSMLTDSTLIPQVKNMLHKIDVVALNSMDSIFSDLKKSTTEVHTFSTELKVAAQEINAGKGSLGMLLKSDTTQQELQAIISNMNESAIKLNENLEALKHNWFFRRYYKKKQKNKLK